MTTVAIVACAICALLGWCATLEAVKVVASARAQGARCPCQDLHSIGVDAAWTGHATVGERAAREVH
ncbi:hypothetical protein [Methylobacterium sp. MA0201]|uniref:hypothetical protein n=1 Tax=Methylobacterium alsaeris TaxID=3344826 RepID=UPI0037573754